MLACIVVSASYKAKQRATVLQLLYVGHTESH